MKKILIFFVGLLYLSLSSCSEDKLDEINFNPNDPVDVGTQFIIPDVMVSTAFRVVGGDYNFYASLYTEHNVGTFNQFYTAEIRGNQPIVSSTYNNAWEAAYNNLYRLKIIIDKCSEGGSEEGNYHTLGIAQVLTAINLATLTDVVGDVPYSEALLPGEIFTPKVDSQESIYEEIFSMLNNAVKNLEKETTFESLSVQDVINKGDATKWKEAAYGLLARYTMRKSGIAPDYDKVIEYANMSFGSSASECKLLWESVGTSPFAAMYRDRDYYGASQSLNNLLSSLGDPRKDYFWKKHPEAKEFAFAPNGTPIQVQQFYGISALTSSSAPTYLISYHEVEFLKAEAYARTLRPTEAKDALENATIAAFLKIKDAIGEAEEDIEEEAKNYVASLDFDSKPIETVMQQKYISCFEEEALEAYADIRRLKAMGEGNFIPLEHPQGDKFPLRYTYGSSDVTTNKYVAEAQKGIDVYVDNVWWAGGNK